MIRPIRLTHRCILLSLSVVLPLVLFAGIAARKPAASMTTIPVGLYSAPRPSTPALWVRGDLIPGMHCQISLFRETLSGAFSITCTAAPAVTKPDTLVYWSPSMVSDTEKVPDNAALLGAFDAPSLILPSEAIRGANGVLVLFSLADNEIVGVSQPFSTPQP